MNQIILTGSSNIDLSSMVAKKLKTKAHQIVSRFSDGEVRVNIPINIRRKEVYIIQSTTPPNTDSHFIELFLMIDAALRASAQKINVVIPYFGYARQDRIDGRRTSISASRMAKIIEQTGADQIISIDIHNESITGSVNIPWDNLSASRVLVSHLKKVLKNDTLVVSPDKGGVERAIKYSELLGLGSDVAVVYKKRASNIPNQSKAIVIIGDVVGRNVLLVDDIVDTAGTLVNSADYLITKGAESVSAVITHGVLSGDALAKISSSSIEKIYITDSIQTSESVLKSPKLKIISISSFLAEAIAASSAGQSLWNKK